MVVRQNGTLDTGGRCSKTMNRIRELANQKKISTSEIIKKTGLSKSFIYDVIAENSYPTIPVGWKIARSLGSTLDEVFPDKQ